MWSQFTNVTDGQTDRQTTCDRNTALCTKVHRAVTREARDSCGALWLLLKCTLLITHSVSVRVWSEEIYRKSTICDFLLMVKSNRRTVAALPIPFARYFHLCWNRHFAHWILIVDSQRRNAQQYQRNRAYVHWWKVHFYWATILSLTIRVYPHFYPLLPPKYAKSREILTEVEVIAVQGHPRSLTLVPTESAYVTFC